MDSYQSLLASKAAKALPQGLSNIPELNSNFFPFQQAVCEFLLRAGSGAGFLDTGLGKTILQLEWSRVIGEYENRPMLILTPLAVAAQTAREADKFSIEARVIREQAQARPGVNIANYEILHRLDPQSFVGVVLDESSIIKNFTGITTRKLIQAFDNHRWRLCCTATPAPNDHMELGQHSAFLGAMSSNEMLSRWFIADQTNMGRYRLKGHAVESFWTWVASWARCVSKPSDLGYSDDGFILPALNVEHHVIKADLTQAAGNALFRTPDTSATSIHREKRLTVEARADRVAELVHAERDEAWIIWCDTDYEADALAARLPDAIEVRGSMSPQAKEEGLLAFSRGDIRQIISKPSLAGFGLNWQHCARMAFIGLSFSYESFYQAVRRAWRFGQVRPVDAHIVMSDTELAIWHAISRKQRDHEEMKTRMVAAMSRAAKSEKTKIKYQPAVNAEFPGWLKGAA